MDGNGLMLDGNEKIEEAIAKYYEKDSHENLIGVLETIRERMHADGHFLVPVLLNEEDESQFSFSSIQTKDGKHWHVVFTSSTECEKGEESKIVSHFIDSTLKFCLQTEADGFVINPWGQPFMLSKEMIEAIFQADGGIEYSVPDDPITEDLLADGSFLKKAIEISNRNRTQFNVIKLARILRDSYVWIPCNAVFSDADLEKMNSAVAEADAKGDLDSLVGQEFVSSDQVRMIPDILQNGDAFFFPVFSTAEEMGEYGESFSKIQSHFLEAANLAKNNEKKVAGIVINALTEPFVVPVEMFDFIAKIPSSIKEKE